MVPELKYEDLEVSDGLTSRRLWVETFIDKKHEKEKEKIVEDLLEYCGQDTYGMVRILEELNRLAAAPRFKNYFSEDL
jgi:hypothetical protein